MAFEVSRDIDLMQRDQASDLAGCRGEGHQAAKSVLSDTLIAELAIRSQQGCDQLEAAIGQAITPFV